MTGEALVINQLADFEEGDLSDADAVSPLLDAASFEDANTEYLSVADNASLSLTGALSMATWIKSAGANSADTGVFDKYDTGAATGYAIRLGGSSGTNADKPIFHIDGNAIVLGTTLLNDNAWHSLVVRYNGTDTMELWVDGVKEGENTSANQALADNGLPLRLGARADGLVSSTLFDGELAGAAPWERYITDSEIDQYHAGGFGLSYGVLSSSEKVSLISWWPLDESSGARADSHGTNNLSDNNTVTSAAGPIVDNIRVTETAALAGSYGAAFTIEDTTDRYISLTDPASETTVAFEVLFKLDELDASTVGDMFEIVGPATNNIFGVRLNRDELMGVPQFFVEASIWNDAGVESETSRHSIASTGTVTVRGEWLRSSGVDTNDGEFRLYVGGTLVETLSGIDNDTHSIGELRAGPTGIDANVSGVLIVDDFWWGDDTPADITPASAIAASKLGTIFKIITPAAASAIAATTVGKIRLLAEMFVAKFKSYMFPAKEKDYEFEATSTHYTFYARKPDEVK